VVNHRRSGRARVLAVDPHIDRVGFAYFERHDLVERGMHITRKGGGPAKRVRTALIPCLVGLLDRFNPTILLVPNAGPGATRRSTHVAEALRIFANHAREHDVPVYAFSDKDVKESFRDSSGKPARNKTTIIRLLIARWPELRSGLPRIRRTWDPEPYHVPLFNAVALYGGYLDLLERRL
jgi:hypothetical protein